MRISSRDKKKIVIAGSILLVILIAAFGYGMSNRQAYLDQAVTKVKQKLRKQYDVDFKVSEYRFDGLTSVVFEDISLVPLGRDTLVSMDHLGVGIRVWPLLWGKLKVDDLQLENGKISFVKKDSLSNYDFLFKKKNKDTLDKATPDERNFATWVDRLAKEAFAWVPSDLVMHDFELSYTDSAVKQRVWVPEAIIDNGDFETSVFLNGNEAEWILAGNVDADDQTLRLEVSSKQKDAELPFLKGKYGLGVSFDKLIFDLSSIKKTSKNLLAINGSFEYENLVLRHRRLSDEPIILPHAKVQGGLDIANDYLAIQDGSKLIIKDFVLEPTAKITLKPETKVELGIHTGVFTAQNFFDALPAGLFTSLEGVKVDGDIEFNLDFAVALANPDSILFKASIDDVDLKVLKWGKANIDSLNVPFFYDAYDDTTIVRRLWIGPENPNFVPIDKIPYVLKTTVRNTEDPFFYKHNGFEEEAFKLSISTNLKEKKFKRGASTISMQLVKNVFLNRKKTMDRKIEEILLVWLMEASGAISKDRLLEIYFNVIEWGKNVYGVEEAAQYYFNKKATDLNLGESLFLSSIVPRPKTGLSSFDHTGHLKPWVKRHFYTYGGIMRKVGDLKNVAVPEDYGFYEVVLKPSLRPRAPVVADTLGDNLFDPDLLEEINLDDNTTKKSILDKLFN